VKHKRRRRNSKAGDTADILFSLVLLGIGGVVVYAIYKSMQAGLSTDPNGQSNGLLNNLNASLFPQSFPGGGEVAGSSETYTGAATTSILNPFAVLSEIFGGSPQQTTNDATPWASGVSPVIPAGGASGSY